MSDKLHLLTPVAGQSQPGSGAAEFVPDERELWQMILVLQARVAALETQQDGKHETHNGQ